VTERPLSFCMVTTFYPPFHFGGDAMYVYRLSNALARRGHRVTVVHCADAHTLLGGKAEGAPFPHHPEVAVRRLHSRLGRVSPIVTYLTGRPGLKRRPLERILAEPFDVVHFHNVSLVGGPEVLRYGSAIKLYTMHEHWLVCPMHILWQYNRKPCDQARWLPCTLSFGRPPQLWRYGGLMERALDEIDVFLAPSRFTAEKHRERGFRHPISHLPQFLPEDAAPPADAIEPDLPRPYFLFAGRLERIKGLHTLLEVFRRYRSASLLVAGEGKEGPALRRQAADLPHVRFLGQLDGARLSRLYKGAVALLVPSLGYEVFPLVTLEAFAQGTPAVVRDIGGLPEAVVDSGGGYTYRSNEELERALDELVRDEALRNRLGQEAHAGWLRLWSEEPHLERYLATIGDVRTSRVAAGS
jgi:glycosyltransferase involved in cell wall biosynthesis